MILERLQSSTVFGRIHDLAALNELGQVRVFPVRNIWRDRNSIKLRSRSILLSSASSRRPEATTQLSSFHCSIV